MEVPPSRKTNYYIQSHQILADQMISAWSLTPEILREPGPTSMLLFLFKNELICLETTVTYSFTCWELMRNLLQQA